MLDTPVSVLARARPARVQRDTPLREAVRLLRQERTRCLAVMHGDALVGIFTDQDMLQKCFSPGVSGDTDTGLVMNSPVITVTPDSSIHDALDLIDRERIRHLPLVESDGTLRAIIRARDILNYLAESMPESVLNQPPSLTYPSSREGG